MYTKKERVIADLKPGQLKIEFTTNEALIKSGAAYLKIKIPIGEEKFIEHEFDISKNSACTLNIEDS